VAKKAPIAMALINRLSVVLAVLGALNCSGAEGSGPDAGSGGALTSAGTNSSAGTPTAQAAGANASGAGASGTSSSNGGGSGGTVLGTAGAAGAAGAESGSGGSPSGGSGGGGGGPALDAHCFYPQDLSFKSKGSIANPYSDVSDFKVTFTGSKGTQLVVPGFYTGADGWKVRFAPTRAESFKYVTSSVQDPSLDGVTGTVPDATTNPACHGALSVDSAHPHHYLYADGVRPFQMGYEADWLGLMDFGDPQIPKAKRLIDMLAANGFSEVLMNAYASDTGWKTGHTSALDFGPTAEIPWAGSNAAPDYTKMNEAFWSSYDRVIGYLFEKGVTAHLFFKVYTKMVNWPTNGSAADDRYFKYIVARYQAYSNVIWDFSKEAYYEKDQAYIASRLNLIKAADGYQRLRTLHDPDGGQSQLKPNYYDGAGHASTVDFYTDQSSDQYATAKGALSKRAMPYFNAEVTLYQTGNDGSYTYGHHDPMAAVFAASMEVFMAGGYFAYYYSLHAWDVVNWQETPNGIASYRRLSEFVKGTRWYEMSAADNLIGGGAVGAHCLANPGKEYLVYEVGSGDLTVQIAGAPTALSAKWINLTSSAEVALPDQSNGARKFSNPWNAPALLHLVAR
jgi:Domain of unknown function (DUF5060)/Protein of unknown function (DUF4038)